MYRLGNARIVRYYPYAAKALPVLKEYYIQQTNLTGKQETAIKECTSPEELYHCVGRDFFAITPCPSKGRDILITLLMFL